MKISYQTAPTSTNSLTIAGLSTLGNGATATSAVINNYNAGNGNYTDIEFFISITTAASGTSGTGSITVQVAGSLDNTNFEDTTNASQVMVFQAIVNATTYKKLFTVASAWRGSMPPYLELMITNNSGGTLTAGTVVYNGIYFV